MGIKTYYQAEVMGDECGHGHRTFDAAECCAASIIRWRQHQGLPGRFDLSDPDTAASCVQRRTVGCM